MAVLKGGIGPENGSNAIKSTVMYQERWGREINEISSESFSKISTHISQGNLWAARESFKAVVTKTDEYLVARQAMGKILCELYTFPINGLKSQEFLIFLREVHGVYKQLEDYKKSKPPTLGWRAQVILDGLEERELPVETGLKAWNERGKRANEKPGSNEIRISVSDGNIEIETEE